MHIVLFYKNIVPFSIEKAVLMEYNGSRIWKMEGFDMKNPHLVIMAAGMGSRYGGLKQIDKVDEAGHIIIDYSIYDAIKAGFRGFIRDI